MPKQIPCQADPELFFPISTIGPSLQVINQAKHLCRTDCPVTATCLQGAMERAEPCGVWGGELFPLPQVGALRPPAPRPAEPPARKRGHGPGPSFDVAEAEALLAAGVDAGKVAARFGIKPDSLIQYLHRRDVRLAQAS